MNETYIDISKASSSSLVERVGASTTINSFVPIKKIAEIKGLKSTRSIRIAIQKGKYIARTGQDSLVSRSIIKKDRQGLFFVGVETPT